MGTLTRTFEIDQIAQRLFTSSFPAKWLIRQQNPDVHIDYFVETVEATEPTGLVFGVQLKGTGSPKYSGKYVKYSFAKKHLEYYFDKVKQPVFLVVIDVNKAMGYWLFAQDVIKNVMRPNWRHRASIEIKIPLANKLENTEALLKEIKRADAFMRDLYPGSVAAAAKQEELRLMKLDDRFKINVKYDKGATCYELHPKENVSGKIIIRNSSDAIQKMDDLIKRGKLVQFEPGEFSMTGSKIFDSLTEEFITLGVRVEASKTIKCDAVISILNSENVEIHSIHGLLANLKGGCEEITIEAVLPNSPLSMNFKRGLHPSEKPDIGDITISLDIDNWAGQPLLLLPYFEQLYRFASLIDVGNKIKFSFDYQGNKLFYGVNNITEQAYFIKETLPYIELLENARFISQNFEISPIVPKLDTLTQYDAESLAVIRNILETGEHRQNNVGVRVSAVMVAGVGLSTLMLTGKYPEGSIRVNQLKESAYVFGNLIENLYLSHEITNAKLTDESRQKLIQSSLDEDIELEWEGLDGSEYIITRLNKD